MKKYSLEEIENISSIMWTLTYDRWLHYTATRFGWTEKESAAGYKILKDFPRKIKGNEDSLGKIIPIALEIVAELRTCWDNGNIANIDHYDKEIRKLVYREKDSEEIKEIVFDLHEAENILAYAALIKREIEILLLLRRCCEVSMPTENGKDTYMDIFDGDIFNTHDDWYGVKSRVFVATKDENFKQLLYIKGKGYLMNGELNYEQGTYSSHVLSKECVKMGNIYLKEDLIKLTDDGK